MSSTDNKTKILMTGATGYIGGVVLQRLLEDKDAHSFTITALVRDEGKAKKLNSLGVKTALGSFLSGDIVESLAAEADVVIHTADADHIDAAKAILRGLKTRHDRTGQVPVYIHTSGTGVLADSALGDRPGDTIYHDSKVEEIESLPLSAPHRVVDVELVAADEAGYVRTFIVLPSTIYGIGTGPVYDSGIANPYSQQIPGAIKASIDRGQGGMVGQGKNLWPNVDIQEQGDLFKILFDSARTDPTTPHGREGFYFGENGEYKIYDAAKVYTQALYELGKSKTPEPDSFTDEEIQKYFGSAYLGHNSRARAERARALGWKPTKTTADFLASIKADVDAVVKK